MAFDRQKYIDVVLSGRALPAIGIFQPGLPGFNIGLQGLPYDPERARRLLAESTYANNMPPIVYTDAGGGNFPTSMPIYFNSIAMDMSKSKYNIIIPAPIVSVFTSTLSG